MIDFRKYVVEFFTLQLYFHTLFYNFVLPVNNKCHIFVYLMVGLIRDIDRSPTRDSQK